MGLVGDFLRDLTMGGERYGACCTPGAGTWDCRNISEPDCLDNDQAKFYPGLTCAEVECGTQACCTSGECTNGNPDNYLDCQDGVYMGEGTQCANTPCVTVPEDEYPKGCIEADRIPVRPGGKYRWSKDLCHSAQFRAVVRPLDEWPAPPAGGNEFDNRKFSTPGYIEFVSVGPIRANEALPGTEPCARHYAKLVRTDDGYSRLMMCGQHEVGNPDSVQVSEGRFYIESEATRPEHEVEDGIENGYVAAAVGYRTPRWVEALFSSTQVYCDIPS